MNKLRNILIDLVIAALVVWLGFFDYSHFWLARWFYVAIAAIMLLEFILFIRRQKSATIKKNKSLILWWALSILASMLVAMFTRYTLWIPGVVLLLVVLSICTRACGFLVGQKWRWESLSQNKKILAMVIAGALLILGLITFACAFDSCSASHSGIILSCASCLFMFMFGVDWFYTLGQQLRAKSFGTIIPQTRGLFDRFGHIIPLYLWMELFIVLFKYAFGFFW